MTALKDDHEHNEDGIYYVRDEEGDTYEMVYCTWCGINSNDEKSQDQNE